MAQSMMLATTLPLGILIACEISTCSLAACYALAPSLIAGQDFDDTRTSAICLLKHSS